MYKCNYIIQLCFALSPYSGLYWDYHVNFLAYLFLITLLLVHFVRQWYHFAATTFHQAYMESILTFRVAQKVMILMFLLHNVLHDGSSSGYTWLLQRNSDTPVLYKVISSLKLLPLRGQAQSIQQHFVPETGELIVPGTNFKSNWLRSLSYDASFSIPDNFATTTKSLLLFIIFCKFHHKFSWLQIGIIG